MASSSAAPTQERIPVGDALRAGTVMLGGPAVLLGTAVSSGLSSLRAVRLGRRPSPAALACLGAAACYVAAVRPWMRDWGATESEATAPLPGDEQVPDPAGQTTRAVTIDAPVDDVWPWIAQLGQERGGFYSYEWLENLAGCEMRNADRIHAEWQHREVGELVMLHPANGLEVTRFEPGRAFGLEDWGTWVLEPAADGRTRLLVRGRRRRGLALALYYNLFLELPHFLMERRMLLGIKQRVEAA